MEGSYAIVFHFGEGGGKTVEVSPPLGPAFSLNLHRASLFSSLSLSTTIFEQMGCEDGLVVKLVYSRRGHRERIM